MGVFSPYLLMTICVMYAWALSAFQGNMFDASVVAIKYLAPMIYCMCVILRANESEAVLEFRRPGVPDRQRAGRPVWSFPASRAPAMGPVLDDLV